MQFYTTSTTRLKSTTATQRCLITMITIIFTRHDWTHLLTTSTQRTLSTTPGFHLTGNRLVPMVSNLRLKIRPAICPANLQLHTNSCQFSEE
ncbi:AAEL007873-PB [Aedes aegypti]|uniref:AAEL007873-PA n=1 Tax=Aedes aegypti TaxID=7159 RepID=Q170L3_AEDAE|nr:AAEL007873-PA [Aedes aegypti]EAT40383.1 AAEL007873-PB [Aedes aegypti]